MRFGSREKVGQKCFCHIECAIKIDIHHPFNVGIVEVIDPNKVLNDARIVNDAIHDTVFGNYLLRERGYRVFIGDIDDMRR